MNNGQKVIIALLALIVLVTGANFIMNMAFSFVPAVESPVVEDRTEDSTVVDDTGRGCSWPNCPGDAEAKYAKISIDFPFDVYIPADLEFRLRIEELGYNAIYLAREFPQGDFDGPGYDLGIKEIRSIDQNQYIGSNAKVRTAPDGTYTTTVHKADPNDEMSYNGETVVYKHPSGKVFVIVWYDNGNVERADYSTFMNQF